MFAFAHLNGLENYVTIQVIGKIEIYNKIWYVHLFFVADGSVTTPPTGVTTTTSGTGTGSGVPCAVNPCLNGAACYLIAGGGFICNCTQGFTGLLCDAISNTGNALSDLRLLILISQ